MILKLMCNSCHRPVSSRNQPASLSHTLTDGHLGVTLKILKQPEAQHRARYMTEGSRGAIKDVLQQGHPVVQVILTCCAVLAVFL